MPLRRLLALAALLIAIAAGYVCGTAAARRSPLRVTFLDVGQGDSAVIETPSRKCFVVDTGSATATESRGRSVVLPFLRSRGVNRLDAMALTHWDLDHAGGARAVLSGIRIGRLLLPADGPWNREVTDTERDTLTLVRQRGVPIVHMTAGQTVRVGDGVTFDVLNPPPPGSRYAPRSDNDASLVMMVRYGATRILLAGDAETDAEHRMVRDGLDLKADVLKVGHHGSNGATSDRWLNAVQPQVAVISVGKGNAFGHPDPRVLRRLNRHGTRILRTDVTGAITVWSDGRTCRITTRRKTMN